jgi:hypothetical protein
MIRWLTQILCWHEYTRVTDRETGRHYLECMLCLNQTPGIYFTPTKVFKCQEEN